MRCPEIPTLLYIVFEIITCLRQRYLIILFIPTDIHLLTSDLVLIIRLVLYSSSGCLFGIFF